MVLGIHGFSEHMVLGIHGFSEHMAFNTHGFSEVYEDKLSTNIYNSQTTVFATQQYLQCLVRPRQFHHNAVGQELPLWHHSRGGYLLRMMSRSTI